MEHKIDTHRYIARFIIEAQTPLFVGSGESSLLKDAIVYKDCNGFPMIPGTTLAGVLRHALDNDNRTKEWLSIFGDITAKGDASRLKISSALMMLSKTKCSEGILNDSEIDHETLSRFSNLPSRQHVRINEKGVAVKNGLFDNEIVYKGTRFIFELELRGTENDSIQWQEILNYIKNPTFRLGSGTRKGYGNLRVVASFNKKFDFTNELELNEYLDFSPSLNTELNWSNEHDKSKVNSSYITYDLYLKPDSFFLFSEGFGDEEVDNMPKTEDVVFYSEKKLNFISSTVIPASSIKGAIAHRVAYHYNKLMNQFVGIGKSGAENNAVYELFGTLAGDKNRVAVAGNVFISDLYFDDEKIANNKIFNHVAIDRFTGGAIQGALFSEKVSNLLVDELHLSIHVKDNNYSNNVVLSFEETLIDICKGLLPLGGMTTKGNGIFTGILFKNGKEEFNYLKHSHQCQA